MGEWVVSRHGWMGHRLDFDELGLPSGHRMGYMIRRNKIDKRENMVAAFCKCGWQYKDSRMGTYKNTRGQWNWERGRKAVAAMQFSRHIKEVLNSGRMFE